MRSSPGEHQLVRTADFLGKTHAFAAQDTTIDEKRDVAQVAAAAGEGLDVGPAGTLAVLEVIILQFALAGLVANRAVDRMPQQKPFLDHRTRLGNPFAVGNDHQIVGHGEIASRGKFRLHGDFAALGIAPSDFDQAHAATSDYRQRRMPAVVRNFYANQSSSLNAVHALAGRESQFAVVDPDGWHGFAFIKSSIDSQASNVGKTGPISF